MIFIPKKIFGFNAKPKESAKPTVVANTEFIETCVGDISINVLRWEVKDFEIDDLHLTDGHFVTYKLSVNGREYNLYQRKTTFFLNDFPNGIKAVAPSSKNNAGTENPIWHKSDKYWPTLNDEFFSFIGQFYYSSKVAYLFMLQSSENPIYAIFHDDIDRQDAEEHYKLEAIKNR